MHTHPPEQQACLIAVKQEQETDSRQAGEQTERQSERPARSHGAHAQHMKHTHKHMAAEERGAGQEDALTDTKEGAASPILGFFLKERAGMTRRRFKPPLLMCSVIYDRTKAHSEECKSALWVIKVKLWNLLRIIGIVSGSEIR